MSRLFSFLRDAQIKRWAATQGCEVGRRRTEAGRTFYPVVWYDRLWTEQTTEVEDLTELPSYINSKIESGQALRPGEFYIGWCIRHERPPSWCRTPSWIHVTVFEGAPPNHRYDGFDPTPYVSPQAAVDTVAFLGLELGARLQFYADVLYLRNVWGRIPTASYSPEAVEEQILDLVRRSRPELGTEDDMDTLTEALSETLHLPQDQCVKAIQQLIADGRLINERQYKDEYWDSEYTEYKSSPWMRWLTEWFMPRQYREVIRLTDPGWQCELLPCENCAGNGACPVCGGSVVWPGKYCSACSGGRRCRHCLGCGKTHQWRQIEQQAQPLKQHTERTG